ncbi:MAG: hypothetical protein M1830_007772 [Pleopsidium flavum]|nr:MAG: hypothetical protein M1830_007772 [Pleopsidium flavum]
MAKDMLPRQQGFLNSPYPANTKQAAGMINGVQTEVMSISFADKIIVTIMQGGRLAQWIHVLLDSSNPNRADQHVPADSGEGGLLPLPHLTPMTLLGGGDPDREIMGQLYGTQIASAVATKKPEDTRVIVVGLGLSKIEADREIFLDIMELVLKCI